MANKRDKIIAKLWTALRTPATTYVDLAERVSASMGETISVGLINNALTHLRRNAAEYGWTIFHVKRGAARSSGVDDGRYFRCLTDRDGSFFFDDDAEASQHATGGTKATLKQIVTLSKNNIAMLEARVINTRSTSRRADLRDTIADFKYAARKAEIVLEGWEDEDVA